MLFCIFKYNLPLSKKAWYFNKKENLQEIKKIAVLVILSLK